MTEPDIRAAYRDACPGIAGRLLTAHEAAEADAMRAALSKALVEAAEDCVDDAAGAGAFSHWAYRESLLRSAAWATVLWLLLAPEAT